MSRPLESKYAEIALRLLLDQDHESLSIYPLFKEIEWDIFIKLARENRVLIRVFEQLVKLGVQPNEIYQQAVNEEKNRIGRGIELMAEISKVFEAAGIDFVFFKNYQHYPDMGEDIDLFVHGQTNKADSVLISNFKASCCKRTLLHRIAGKTQYSLEGWAIEVEIHHGRMGPMGEHIVFPKSMVENRRVVEIEGVKLWVPSQEDQFIIQVLQRVYGRFYLRISELLYAVKAILMERFDWDYIIETTKSIGIFDGVRFYLNCVGLIYQNVMNKSLPLIKPELSAPKAPVKMKFSDFHYRLPLQMVARTLYIKKFFLDIRAARGGAVGRTCLLPFFAALSAFKPVATRCRQKLGLPSLR